MVRENHKVKTDQSFQPVRDKRLVQERIAQSRTSQEGQGASESPGEGTIAEGQGKEKGTEPGGGKGE